MADHLPRSGPLPRPKSLEEAAEALRAEAIACACSAVTFKTDEFTSLCPRTGQPDFYDVTIEYTPAGRGLESKSLKFYLWAFRDFGVFAEDLAVRIARDVAAAIEPDRVTATVWQKVRGGLALAASHTVSAWDPAPSSVAAEEGP